MKYLSLRTKLFGGFGIIGVLLVIYVMISSFFVVRMGDITTKLAEHPYKVTNTIKDIEIDAYQEYVIFQLTLLNENVSIDNRNQINDYYNKIETRLIVIYDSYLGSTSDVVSVEQVYQEFHESILLGLDAIEAGDFVLASSIQNLIEITLIQELSQEISTIKLFAENKSIEYQAQSEKIKIQYSAGIGAIALIIIVIQIIISTVVIRDLLKPINQIVSTISNAKEGKKYKPITDIRKDEFGVITQSLNSMFEYLKSQKEIDELNFKLKNLKDRENLRITLMSIGDGVITTDQEGNITDINPVAVRMTEYEMNDAIGKPIEEVFNLINKKTRQKIESPIRKALKMKHIHTLEKNTVLVSKNGLEYEISDSAAPILGDNGEIYGVILVFSDITNENKYKEKIEYLSFHDSLTGVNNRNYLDFKLTEISNIEKKNLAVLMGDINGLKLINDAFGHSYGDELLKEIVNILENTLKGYNCDIIRWGGDEFVIIMYDTTIEQVENILKEIKRASDASDTNLPVKPSISFGHASWRESTSNIYQLIILAEDMMYENKLLQKDSLRSGIVNSLETSLFEKSFETEIHCNRVVEYADIMSEKLGLPENKINEIKLLAKLHDIGKISIPEEILTKKGKLTDLEWDLIKKHPAIGHRIASSLIELSHIADGILSHHERYDGDGYPRHLKGNDIPLDARIISIADAYDVMRSDRSYKKAISKEEAIIELKSCSGTQFDKTLVEMFIEEIIKPKYL